MKCTGVINGVQCGADTIEKTIKAKTGKTYAILECTNAEHRSDRDPKFAYSFFPPKTNKGGGGGFSSQKTGGQVPAKSVLEAGVMAQLESLQAKVDKIMVLLMKE